MIRSMRPVIVTAARSRWPLPIITLAVALFLRAMDSGRVDWPSSDMQVVAAAVLYGALIPVLVIALASSWLRGDDGPWSWALARPVTRGRWLRTTLMIDVVTVLACVAFARMVIGPLPHNWIPAWLGESGRAGGYAAVLIAVYSAAAFGGARGSSAIGASLCVVAFAAYVMLLNACAAISEKTAVDVLLQGFRFHLSGWSELRTAQRSLESVPMLSSTGIIAGFAIIVIRRTALELPQQPRMRPLAGLAAVAISIAVVAPWVLIVVVMQWIA
jgi:hypothetical protein